MDSETRKPSWYLWLALLVALSGALVVQTPRLLNEYAMDEDFRNLYWLHRLNDPAVFQDDPLISHQLIELSVAGRPFTLSKYSPGYGFLFQLAGLAIPPILFSKLLVFPLILTAVYYLFQIAQTMGTARQAFGVCVVFIVLTLTMSTDISLTGGLQRSFTLPLLLAMAVYLMRGSDWKAATVVFSSVIYPPLFILNALAYGLSLWRWRERGRPYLAWHRLPPLLVASVLAVLLLVPAFLVQVGGEETLNQATTGVPILQDPAYGPDGRYPLFQLYFYGDGGPLYFNRTGLLTTVLVIASLPIWLILRAKRQRLPRAIWLLVYAGLAGFLLSWLVILVTSSFALHLPNRYLRGALFLASFLFVAFNGGTAVRVAAQWIGQYRNKSLSPERGQNGEERPEAAGLQQPRSPFPLLLAVPLLLLLTGLLFTVKPAFYQPPDDEKALFAFLATLPLDSLIAGDPCLLDGAPIYTRHMVLYSCETPNPNPSLMLTALDAYYAEAEETVAQFCHQYQVTHLVVDEATFASETVQAEEYYYEPINSQIAPVLHGRSQFILPQTPTAVRLFQNGSIFVTACPE